MRIESPGISRRGPPYRFRFGGRDVEAYPGETIAAALINADIWGLRTTRTGQPRGLFCGMGVCGECSVLVDGVQQRACLQYATPGAEVCATQAFAPVVHAELQSGTRLEVTAPDLLIVGAGPAGLAAARLAATAGLDVLVVDERNGGGGQYFKQPGRGFAVDPGRIDRQFADGADRIAGAEAAGVRFLLVATVWNAFAPNELIVNSAQGMAEIKARRIVLSPGAYERPHMFPGWTLPGVMTTGAAQTLLRGSQTAPGKRVLVAGNGPLNLQVARELVRAGAEVVALAELAPPVWEASPLALLTMVRTAPGLVWDGARHLAALRSARVPVFNGHVIVRSEGDDKVNRATIARIGTDGAIKPGSERTFDVDAICLGYGFLAQNEIARALGCAHRVDDCGALVTDRDGEGRTSVREVFLAGDAGGLGGARIAEAQGMISAAAAAADLGASIDRTEVRRAERLLERHRSFQDALWSIYRPKTRMPDLTEPATPVCRCEEIDRAAIDNLLDTELKGLGAIKRASRLGMGRCQGRYCGVSLAQLVEARCGETMAADKYFAPRSPFKPVTIASVAASSNE